MAQLLQNESETDYDEGKDIAEWKRICEEQGIDVTSGEGEPAGPSEVDEDPDDTPQITNMWAQMKVLHPLLKHQQQELREMYYVHRNTWMAQELYGISKIP